MPVNINSNYSRFYKGAQSINSYGSGVKKKDTLVKYEFNTRDALGNKIMDKMTKEETLKAMKDISSQYGDNVIVEFSGEGLAALVESKKGNITELSEEQMAAKAERDAAFQREIKHLDRRIIDMPDYSGIYEVDKAIAVAVENCSKEERGFVYDIIRQNFLVKNIGNMTEEERLANISLGMEKAEFAADYFISEDNKKAFLNAMKAIADLAISGKADANGNMNYGVQKPRYLGHGSGLVATTNTIDMMRTLDPKSYEEYQKICAESTEEDRPLAALKYLTKWAAKKT
ncbi:MAG TPA: hypothetical protein VIL05_02155 [Thermoclostridium sp.]